MSNPVIKVENLSKQYRLGEVGTGTISHDLNRWWHKIQGKEDPYLRIGESNDRSKKGNSEYVWALQDINFEVQQGEVLGIIGKNGAGKSTLLKILSKVTAPTIGAIKAKGRIAALLEVGTGFHPELTGRENIYLNGTILGMSKREVAAKLDEIVDFSGVERYLDTPVKRYSSGMMVRLAFSVAAHLEPEILIVDEVLAVGDAEFQKKCLGKMEDVSKKEGRTVLLVSHQLGMIRTLCNSCVYLEKGKVSLISSTDEVLKRYLERSSNDNGSEKNNISIAPNFDIPAQIQTLKMVDETGHSRNEYDVFEKKFLEIKLEVYNDELSFILFYYLEKNGEIIICSHENDLDPSRLNARKKGIYDYRVSLPVNLKAGSYSFSAIGIGIPNQGAVHTLEDVLAFSLTEYSFDSSLSGFSSKRPGFILADSEYQITSAKYSQ